MTRIGRRRRLATAGIALLLVSLMLAGSALFALAAPISTTKDLHDAFEKGCNAGGGIFTDHPDGSFSCKIGDVTITCTVIHTPCTVASQVSPLDTLGIVNGGDLQVAQPANPTPTPTRTRSAGSVLGGIRVTPGPAKLPPNYGYLFGRSWTCPANISHDFQTLFLKCNPDNSIEFSVYGAGLAQQHAHGGFTYSGLTPGGYTIREIEPNGYGVDNTTYCSVASSLQYPAGNTFHLAYVIEGYYEFQLAAGQYIYCEWFNTPPSTATPSPTRVVKGVIGGVLQNPQKTQGNPAPTATAAAGTPAP